ncbi:flagellar basal body L-ring protein FlgH [Marinobacter sp. R17]|uniref:flagellar basal body L-ring protein FlgH n=1 Tax=Marinobacter sp. R17 TaxID=2484250 RepID=UPI000F4AFA21|nr:flagellar basal body L-ring protein FlgH [Marinobacter sp. R17]ROU01560.1 flagellar basal body L-ring protein FlgH [Marinobacter sp. R17]
MQSRLTPLLIVILAALQGCQAVSRPRAVPDDPDYAPVMAQSMMQRDPSSGAIYQTTRNFNFYGDRVALNVGDVLMVNLEEQTQASKSADNEIKKENQVDFNDGAILGLDKLNLATNPQFDRDFKGQASADQSNSLAGSITVTVTDVYPNGVLRIRGEKWISLTNGDEYIRLTGLVRPQDISTDNTVSSNRIADARIAYGGTGDFDDATRQGWLSRFFNSEWFPL